MWRFVQFCLALLNVGAHPSGEGDIADGTGREAEYDLRGGLFCSVEMTAIDFEEQHTDDEACALVPVEKRVVTDNSNRVGSSQVHDVRIVSVRVELARPCQRGLQQRVIANACGTAFESENAMMNSEGVSLVNPNGAPGPSRFCHLESAWRVLR